MNFKFSISKHFQNIILMAMVMLFSESNEIYAQVSTPPEVFKEKILAMSIAIEAPLDSVWARWTSEKGIKKFFAPACRLEPKPLGRLDIYFAPDAPPGKRGAENNLILGVQDKKMLSFTWDAPPQWPEIRMQRTLVILRFYPLEDSKTLITLTQTGWGTGTSWDAVYDYFGKAWSGFVLPNLKYSLEEKPVDWTKLPTGLQPAEIIEQ